MAHRLAIGICCRAAFTLTILATAATGHADTPIPTGKDAYTDLNWRHDLLRWHDADLQLYRRYTIDPKAIQAASLKFISAYFKHTIIAPDGDRLTHDELLALGEQAVKAGSSDPLVLSLLADTYVDANDLTKARPIVENAFLKYKKTSYPTEVRYRVLKTWRLVARAAGDPHSFDQHFEELVESWTGWLKQTADQPENQRYLWSDSGELFTDGTNLQEQERLYRATEKLRQIDPWMKNLIAGKYYMNRARQSRPEESKENYRIAGTFLLNAWKASPRFPTPAADMIIVASALGGDLTPRTWFDRAVSVQMDYEPAYINLLTVLLSVTDSEGIRRFGMECAETKRFDTDVPYRMIMVLQVLDNKNGGTGDVFLREGVYEQIKSILDKLAREPAHADNRIPGLNRSFIAAMHVIYAIRAGDYDDARRALDEAGDHIERDRLQRNRISAVELSEVYALTGKTSAQMRALRRNLEMSPDDQDGLRSALESLDAAAKQNNEEKANLFFEFWRKRLNQDMAFGQGKWVSLDFDQQLAQWRRVSGKWRPESPTSVIISGDATDPEMVLEYYREFPVPYEVSCDIQLVDTLSDKMPNMAAGFVVGDYKCDSADKRHGRIFYLDLVKRRAGVMIPCRGHLMIPLFLGDKNALDLKLRNSSFDQVVNGTRCPFGLEDDFMPGRLGLLVSVPPNQSATVSFSNVRVKKLSSVATQKAVTSMPHR